MRLLSLNLLLCVAAVVAAGPAWSAEPATLADLQAPVPLSRAEVQTLMSGATVSRVNDKGNTHRWTNEPGGEMVVSSDNRSDGKASTARARWSVDEQGRYCLQVHWKRGAAEDSCRYILRAGDRHFAVEALEPASRKLYPLEIGR